MVPVELRHGVVSRRVALVAMRPDASLRRVVDAAGRAHAIPRTGVLLTTKLASVLGVHPGDTVQMEMREGTRPRVAIVVAGVADELIGTTAYADLDYVNRLSGEGATMSNAAIAVDPRDERTLYAELKRLPALSGVAIRAAMIEGFRSSMAESFRLSLGTAVIFAVVIAFGVVYNGARVALSERSRELASLRVLGFSRREVTVMLFEEQILLIVTGMLIGAPLGYGLCTFVTRAGDSEMFRIPLVLGRAPYLFAIAVIAGATALSAISVRRRIRALDIVECLKTGE
jgi:putative ABC transport system permease protein